ncbi:ATP-binding protein [Alteromonas sp. AMM-1]|uniref:ATP-binding protein n=1 Tax=Alteromonas sp. AMM-1 TaxID=3394233 RepID=UPI0039A496CD
MSRLPSLRQYLQRIMLPKLAVILVAITLIIFSAVFLTANRHIGEVHKGYLTDLKGSIEQSIELTRSELITIANNDLLVNGLIDMDYQQYYLPLFIQSTQITEDRNLSLALFNFAGDKLLFKNWDDRVPVHYLNAWQTQVLSNAESYTSVNEDGVFIVAPVMINGMAEGALAFYVDSLHWIVSNRPNVATQLIVGEQGKVLYSSHPKQYPVGTNYYSLDLNTQYTASAQWDKFLLVSFEPFINAYNNIFWLIPILTLAVISIILTSLYSVRAAANLSSLTLQRLHENLEHQIDSSQGRSEKAQEPTLEMSQIRYAFEQLIESVNDLSLSNNRFRNITNSMEEILVVVNNDDQIILSNSAFTHFTEHYEQTFDDILKNVLHPAVRTAKKLQLSYQKGTGEQLHVSWNTSPMLNDEGEFIGHILVGENITQRVILEKDVLIRTRAMNEATVSIVISDINQPGNPLIYVNTAFEKLTGYSKTEVLGKNCRFLQGSNTAPEHIQQISDAINTGQGVEITLLNYRKDGSEFYNKLTLSPIQQRDGSVSHFIGIQQDVTLQEQTSRYLEEAKLRAEESTQLKSRFLASMSHEIRTPINGIYGMLGLLTNGKLDESQQNYVRMARQSTKDLLHIINDILDFSKIEAGKLTVERHDFNLMDLLNETIEHYAFEGATKDIPVTLTCSLSEQWVSGDTVRIRQILSNLLSNAVKFTSQGKVTVQATLVRAEDHFTLKCEVSDTGIGIETSQLDNIFSLFSQEDESTTRQFGGTGLGLAISKQLIQLMGGDIHVTSTKGKGSTFSFSVLLYPALKDAPAQYTGAQSQSADSFATGSYKPLVLLVEDNTINQVVAREHLNDCRVMVTANGQEAIDALKGAKAQFDLILMDCQMPVMDGYEATRRIRSGEAGDSYQNVPIIALTANAMKGDRDTCIAAGMNDYISKPFNESELRHKVWQWYNIAQVD